jgi:hypothetical protein
MAYDESITDRIRQMFQQKHTAFIEKKMMGGLCFMVDDKMYCGIHFDKIKQTDLLMARIDEDADLEYWIQLCINFNPIAKSSKKK